MPTIDNAAGLSNAKSLLSEKGMDETTGDNPGKDIRSFEASITILKEPKTYSKLKECWHDFKVALWSVEEEFDQWHWIKALTTNFILWLVDECTTRRMPMLGRLWKYHRPLIPFFALGLVSMVLYFYIFGLRTKVFQPRWCPSEEKCYWITFHDGVVAYLGGMILWSYCTSVYTSPGVALPRHVIKNHNKCIKNLSDLHTSISDTEEYRWTSVEGRGGCCCFDPPRVNVITELNRLKKYTTLVENFTNKQENILQGGIIAAYSGTAPTTHAILYPSLAPSKCRKCQIMRPPRCRHCSNCNRCVLQMDHHCPWMNTCIGYNNYRYFIQTIGFLMCGCLYGSSMLYKPFVELVSDEIILHGGLLGAINNLKLTARGTTPWNLIHDTITGRDGGGLLDPELAIKIDFVLLLGVGITMVAFISSHIRTMIAGITTLERIIQLDKMQASLLVERVTGDHTTQFVNPFDQGWYKNIVQLFGTPLWLLLLPLHLEPPDPYLPSFDTIAGVKSTKKYS